MRLYHLPQMPLTQPGVQETAEFIAPVYTQTNEIDVPVGSSNFNFDLPTLPATAKLNYFVDVRLADDQGQAVNWAFTQIRPGTLAQAETTLEFTPAVLDMKLNPTAPPLLTIKLLKTAATDLAARITLVDNRDRLLGTQDATLPAGQQQLQVPLAIPVGQIMASMLMARVELQTAQGQPVWIGLADLPVVHRPWPDFTFFMWAGGSGYIGRQRLRAVAGSHGHAASQ